MVFPSTNENIQAIREACTVLLREEVYFVDEEFLYKKVNRNGIHMRIMVSYRRYSKRHGSYTALLVGNEKNVFTKKHPLR